MGSSPTAGSNQASEGSFQTIKVGPPGRSSGMRRTRRAPRQNPAVAGLRRVVPSQRDRTLDETEASGASGLSLASQVRLYRPSERTAVQAAATGETPWLHCRGPVHGQPRPCGFNSQPTSQSPGSRGAVGGLPSNATGGSTSDTETPGGFPSGQRGQTVNLMATPSQVRILLSPPFRAPPSRLR